MKLHLNQTNQFAGGGSYVCVFDAEVELLEATAGVTAQVVSSDPPDADAELVELAREAIRRSAEEALSPRSLGACLRISGLVIHEVDFKINKFTLFTALALHRLLKEAELAPGG